MAINTYATYLMYKTGGSYAKLIDIKDYPDLIQPPEQLDATTLSDDQRVYTPGIKDAGGALEFTCNFSASDFTTIQGLEGTEQDLAVWFGEASGTPDGHLGKYAFKGYLYASKKGGSVNEVSEMTVGAIPSTVITFSAS